MHEGTAMLTELPVWQESPSQGRSGCTCVLRKHDVWYGVGYRVWFRVGLEWGLEWGLGCGIEWGLEWE